MDSKTGDSSIEKSLFDYLKENLPTELKRQISGPTLKEVLHCIAAWVKKDRLNVAIAQADTLANTIQGIKKMNQDQVDTEEENFDPNFLDELKKL